MVFDRAVDIMNEKGGDWQPKNINNKILHKKFGSWEIFVNGNNNPVEVNPKGWKGVILKPYTMIIFSGDWIFGILNPFQEMIGDGEDVNGDLFLKDLSEAE